MPLSIRMFFGKKKKMGESVRTRWIFYFPIIGLAIIAFFLYIPDIYVWLTGEPKILFSLEFSEKINILLTFAISIFAAVEGYSTYMMVILEDKRNRIEDARNELEKAYGPLYALLNEYVPFGEDEKTFQLDPEGKSMLDHIMATYPFMFPLEIYDYWRGKVQKKGVIVKISTMQPITYEVYKEFRDKINEEYDRRVKEYNKLLKK